MCADVGELLSLFWCTKDGPLAQFSICSHMVANGGKVPETSTICPSLPVINTVLWLVPNGWLVAEIWLLQVLVVGYV